MDVVLVVEVRIVQLSEGSQLQFSLFVSSQVYQQRSTSSPHLGRIQEKGAEYGGEGAEERKGREGREGMGGGKEGRKERKEGARHGRTKERIEKRTEKRK